MERMWVGHEIRKKDVKRVVEGGGLWNGEDGWPQQG